MKKSIGIIGLSVMFIPAIIIAFCMITWSLGKVLATEYSKMILTS